MIGWCKLGFHKDIRHIDTGENTWVLNPIAAGGATKRWYPHKHCQRCGQVRRVPYL